MGTVAIRLCSHMSSNAHGRNEILFSHVREDQYCALSQYDSVLACARLVLRAVAMTLCSRMCERTGSAGCRNKVLFSHVRDY